MPPDLRSITVHEIVAREKKSAIAVAAPTDFVLNFSGEIPPERGRLPGVAYCADFSARHMWLARGRHSGEWLNAPFLWDAQFRMAEQIAKLPFERIEELIPDVLAQPTFVFSISRCGSTLISSLLSVCGLTTVSEPDLLTQLAVASYESKAPIDPSEVSLLIRACVASLASQRSERLAVKLRSQCNAISSAIVTSFPRGKFVVMLRERASWVASRYTAFGGDPRKLAQMYSRGVRTYHRLWSDGASPVIVWYEDVLNDPVALLRSLDARGIPLSVLREDLIHSVLAKDSQRESPLARERRSQRQLTGDQLREFEEEWQRIRPTELIERHSLERVG